MTSKKIRSCSLLLGISMLSACSSSFPPKIESTRNKKNKVTSVVIKHERKKKPDLIKPPEPVLLLRDSPRVHKALIYFNGPGKSFIDDGLARREKYEEMIQLELEAAGLPEELSNVALIESRYIADARSPSGAVGMWQFMSGTARSLGLQVGFFTDERKSPKKSTRAAVKYLKTLYQEHGDWFLAIAAYNAGSGNIKKAVERCGTKDFFKFEGCSGLSEETLNFVSRFVAVTAIIRRLNYYGD